MVDKPRNPRRPGAAPGRKPRSGAPGEQRDGEGRRAGKPVRGPAPKGPLKGPIPFAGPRSAGPRSEGPRSERPRFEGPRSERPRSERPRFEGPRSEAPRSERPRGEALRTQGRPTRKPAPARTPQRENPGMDPRTVEMLQKEGLLSSEGRKMLGAKPLDRPKKGPAQRSRTLRPGARAAYSPIVMGEGLPQRLQKVMAQGGVASRRHSEELIQAGRVSVNGDVVTELGTKVTPGKDIVEVDGRALGKAESLVHILLNKPKGYVTTLFDPQGRKKVTDLLGGEVGQRVYPVGRLDYETEGLLLLTNDGELANALMHPSRQVKKTYIAKVRGVPGPAKIKALESGIELEDGVTAPAEVKMIEVKGPNASTVSLRIHEGRNRQVRRMFEAIDHEVIHLKRSTLGPLHLGDLPVGEWRELTDRELLEMRKAVGIKPPRDTVAPAAQPVERKGSAPRRGRSSRREEPAGEGRPSRGRPALPTKSRKRSPK